MATPLPQLITVKQIAALAEAGESTVWKWAKVDPAFPKPLRLSKRSTRWRLAEIEAWLAAKQTEAAA